MDYGDVRIVVYYNLDLLSGCSRIPSAGEKRYGAIKSVIRSSR